MQLEPTLTLYVVRNASGQFFRAKGYGGGGQSWVNDINKAKVYGKLGGARSIVTYFATHHTKYPIPVILKLDVSNYEILNETERVAKSLKNKAEKEAKLALAQQERDLKYAEDKLKEAQLNLEKIRKK